jgi:hypothetical protein
MALQATSRHGPHVISSFKRGDFLHKGDSAVRAGNLTARFYAAGVRIIKVAVGGSGSVFSSYNSFFGIFLRPRLFPPYHPWPGSRHPARR